MMKHETQSNSEAGAPVDSELRKTIAMMLAALCVLIAGGLSWVLLLGSLGGNWLCIIGFVYGIVVAFPAFYMGVITSGDGKQK